MIQSAAMDAWIRRVDTAYLSNFERVVDMWLLLLLTIKLINAFGYCFHYNLKLFLVTISLFIDFWYFFKFNFYISK